MASEMLPLPIELREKDYRDFSHQHTLDEQVQFDIKFMCETLDR